MRSKCGSLPPIKSGDLTCMLLVPKVLTLTSGPSFGKKNLNLIVIYFLWQEISVGTKVFNSRP